MAKGCQEIVRGIMMPVRAGLLVLFAAGALLAVIPSAQAIADAPDVFTIDPRATLRFDRSTLVMNVAVNCHNRELVDLALSVSQEQNSETISGQGYADSFFFCDGETHAFQIYIFGEFHPGSATAQALVEDVDTGAQYANSGPVAIHVTGATDTSPILSPNIELPSVLPDSSGAVLASFRYRCETLTFFVGILRQTRGVGRSVGIQTSDIPARCDGAVHRRTVKMIASSGRFSLGRATFAVYGYECFDEGCGVRDSAERLVRLAPLVG